MADTAIDSVLEAYGLPRETRAERVPRGLIQHTYFLDLPHGGRRVAQRMHSIFGEGVLTDIDAVTAHLDAAGMETPRLLRTQDGALAVRVDGELWRLFTYLEGETVDQVDSPERARQAGGLVGRFHARVSSLEHEFVFVRPGAHDTGAHFGRLERALAAADDPHVARLAEEILALGRTLPYPTLRAQPRRVGHGDLKISNVLYRGAQAVALLDLDTLGRLPVAYELGDALRSWSNPLGEDVEATKFDVEVFAAAVAGYAATGNLTAEERESIAIGTATVCIELASRFCTDAVEDSYFGWDPARFPSRREHNRVRAVGQLTLGRQVLAQRAAAEEAVKQAFG